MKAAALGGVRPAAVEYAAVFDSPEFFELAERMAGDVDADRMAQIAATPDARAAWLRTAAEGGSDPALRTLARGGDAWTKERLAEHGDIDALRDVAGRAVEHGDLAVLTTPNGDAHGCRSRRCSLAQEKSPQPSG